MIPGYETLQSLKAADQAIVVDLITALSVGWHRLDEAHKRATTRERVALAGLRNAVEELLEELSWDGSS